MKHSFQASVLGLLLSALAPAATLKVGSGQRFAMPSDAIKVANDGDVIEIAPGAYDGDVATIHANKLLIRGVGSERAKLPAAGRNAAGKGIWVIAGSDVTVENIEFSGARVPDLNGAGIRAEGQNLTVRNCRFTDCEDGILGGAGEMLIEHCQFDRCGPVANPATHSLYIGERCTRLVFRFNYSTFAIEGHLLKTRARENWILYNRLSDENGTGSAVADFPNGGYVVMVGNILQKGPRAQNTRVIVYGMEGIKYDRNALFVVNNTMVYENHRSSAFFVNVQNKPAGFAPVIRNNLCVGNIPLSNCPGADETGNLLLRTIDEAGFANPAGYDYHLTVNSPAIGKAVAAGSADGFDLAPRWQYAHPCGTESRPDLGALDIGASSLAAPAKTGPPPAGRP